MFHFNCEKNSAEVHQMLVEVYPGSTPTVPKGLKLRNPAKNRRIHEWKPLLTTTNAFESCIAWKGTRNTERYEKVILQHESARLHLAVTFKNYLEMKCFTPTFVNSRVFIFKLLALSIDIKLLRGSPVRVFWINRRMNVLLNQKKREEWMVFENYQIYGGKTVASVGQYIEGCALICYSFQ